MSKSYSIREAKPEDAGHILKLIKELADYEKMLDVVKTDEKEIAENLSKWFFCILLEYRPANDEKTDVIAFAIWDYCFAYYGRMAHLEFLFVSPAHRGEGLGYSLLQCVTKICHEKGCKGLRLALLGWNQLAKRFYEKVNAKNLTETEKEETMLLIGENFLQLAMQAPNVALSR